MVVGNVPFRGKDNLDIYNNIKQQPIELPGHLSAPLQGLLADLLQKDPNHLTRQPEVGLGDWATRALSTSRRGRRLSRARRGPRVAVRARGAAARPRAAAAPRSRAPPRAVAPPPRARPALRDYERVKEQGEVERGGPQQRASRTSCVRWCGPPVRAQPPSPTAHWSTVPKAREARGTPGAAEARRQRHGEFPRGEGATARRGRPAEAEEEVHVRALP